MTDDDLATLSLTELKRRQKDIATAVPTIEDRQRAEARARVEAVDREMGYSLAEPIGAKVKATRASAPARYNCDRSALRNLACPASRTRLAKLELLR